MVRRPLSESIRDVAHGRILNAFMGKELSCYIYQFFASFYYHDCTNEVYLCEISNLLSYNSYFTLIIL